MGMPAIKSGFEKWQEGINAAVGNVKWDAWDCEIQLATNEYNRHLAKTTGYILLNWQIIKAMVWVETGANNPEWAIKPMQIGVAGDPGLASLLSGDEGGELIVPPLCKLHLTKNSAKTIPAYNIRAGIGYLLMRMAYFEYCSVIDADKKVYEVVVKPGDSLDKIARKRGSTVELLTKLNPTVRVLQPGQVLKFQRATVQRIITGWRQVTTTLIAQRYNGGGDPNYAKKLDHALTLIRQGENSLCAQ